MLPSFSSAPLIAWVTADGLPKLEEGRGSCFEAAPLLVAPSLMPLQRASWLAEPGDGVDAQDVLGALFGEFRAARLAGLVVVRPDVLHRADPLGRFDAARVVDEHRDALGDGLLDRGVLVLGHPVRYEDRRRVLRDGGQRQLGDIRAEVVVVLRTEVGDLAAARLHQLRRVLDTALDRGEERVVGLAADDVDAVLAVALRAGRRSALGRRRRLPRCIAGGLTAGAPGQRGRRHGKQAHQGQAASGETTAGLPPDLGAFHVRVLLHVVPIEGVSGTRHVSGRGVLGQLVAAVSGTRHGNARSRCERGFSELFKSL